VHKTAQNGSGGRNHVSQPDHSSGERKGATRGPHRKVKKTTKASLSWCAQTPKRPKPNIPSTSKQEGRGVCHRARERRVEKKWGNTRKHKGVVNGGVRGMGGQVIHSQDHPSSRPK